MKATVTPWERFSQCFVLFDEAALCCRGCKPLGDPMLAGVIFGGWREEEVRVSDEVLRFPIRVSDDVLLFV